MCAAMELDCVAVSRCLDGCVCAACVRAVRVRTQPLMQEKELSLGMGVREMRREQLTWMACTDAVRAAHLVGVHRCSECSSSGGMKTTNRCALGARVRAHSVFRSHLQSVHLSGCTWLCVVRMA